MSAFDQVLNAARAHKRRIVLPESLDERILIAAIDVEKRGLATPILVGGAKEIHAAAASFNLNVDHLEILDPLQSADQDAYVQSLIEKRAPRNIPVEKAIEACKNPLTFACLSLGLGKADGCVAGAMTATADVVRNTLRYVGKKTEVSVVSSFFIMLLNDSHPVRDVIVIADCALVIEPDADELASIAISTGQSAKTLLNLDPNIGMLSFSTNGSARHAAVTKVRDACKRAQQAKPDWRIIGEIQLDAAVVPPIQHRKFPEEACDSPCNILIFPNLDAGNIGYKLIERFGGAQALGPILQGLQHPVNDLSRGCTSDDVTNIIAITAAQCEP
ncbi:MAG: phosphate acetyltransferase [Gammaproteobacteria bacterium]|nr:phosphate acetyltransferase [Gammaproteobacteria bacterium]